MLGHNSVNIFKWKRNACSSLETGLLNDCRNEIELSGYRRRPSPGSESPSGLLDGECLNVEAIPDLDLFFERLYNYYSEKGLWCIIIKWIVELFSLAFLICFSGFFLLIVDWVGLRNAKCGMIAVESGMKPCDLAKEAIHHHPLTPFTISKAFIVCYLGILSFYLLLCFLRIFIQLKDVLKTRKFYHDSLSVTDSEIQTISWTLILDKVVQLQSSQQLCVVKNLSAHDIVMRLMRKENYLIGMLNKGVLAFPISRWVPGAGPTVKSGNRLILTKTLEWSLNWCILQNMFDRNFFVGSDFVSSPNMLKKRLRIVGFVMFLLSPFLVIFMLVHLFLRHAEQFYNHPSAASSRRWSNLAKWVFREFNEVDHLFKHRVKLSVHPASDYLRQFPSPIISIVAKFISFVSGGFAAVLIIIAFLEESLLEGHIFGRNLLWYAAVFGTITAISRAAIPDELLVVDAQATMSHVIQHSHYMPKKWRRKENTEFVRNEFGTLFQYTGMMLLEEMVSILLTPYLLIFVIPERVDAILRFISDFTVHVEGVGHVCSFSAFDFQNHGNSNYGSPHNSQPMQRSSQGKMEKSFLSFHNSYTTWEPDADGKQFLLKLAEFRERNLQIPMGGIPSSLFGSMWMFDDDQRNCPYILDCYYASRPQNLQSQSDDYEKELSLQQSYGAIDDSRRLWLPSLARVENTWGDDAFGARSTSDIEASISAPLFNQSVLRTNHEDKFHTGNMGKSRWWARRPRDMIQNETDSFMEPPSIFNNIDSSQTMFQEPPIFNRYQQRDSCHLGTPIFNCDQQDSCHQEDGEEQLKCVRRSHLGLAKTFSMDNHEEGGGEFNLPFDNIYSRPTSDYDPTSEP